MTAVLLMSFCLLVAGRANGQTDNKDQIAKGQYVFAVAGGCACHTEPKKEANITLDKETGIGDWKREDIAELLKSATKPNADNVQGLMYEVIQGVGDGYKDMTKEDALAIADSIKSIPAMKNKVK